MTGVAYAAEAHGTAHGPTYLFELLGLGVSHEVITEWGVMLLLLLLALALRSRLQRVPRGAQALAERAVHFLIDDVIAPSIGGREKAKRYLPFLATLFFFILFANYSELLPGAVLPEHSHLPGLKPPTSALSVTVGLAIVAFFATQYAGLREKGLSYFGHFFKPYPFMFPLNVLEELVRPVSLSLRLFGNIFGEDMVLAVLLGLVPWVIPVPIMALDLLFGFLQAFIFATLTAVYIGGAIGEGH